MINNRSLGHYALCVSIGTAVLAGCGGSRPPIGAPVAMPQTSTLVAHADRGKSWMLPEAKNEDLLYVSGFTNVLVYSFPEGKLVGTLTGFSAPYYPRGLCSDRHGNVFFVGEGSQSQSLIYEYAHGGSDPITTLTDPGLGLGCGVDPQTGDLAVTNLRSSASNYYGNIAVYRHARGKPTIYSDPNVSGFYFCAYDDAGNLFADNPNSDDLIDELPKGGTTLTEITLSQAIFPASIQWNGNSFAIGSGCCGKQGDIPVYQVQVSGSSGTVTGPTLLSSAGDRRGLGFQLWIQGKIIAGPDRAQGQRDFLNFWRYPRGGKPIKMIRTEDANMFGVTVSASEHR
jgi:hypothetical protein